MTTTPNLNQEPAHSGTEQGVRTDPVLKTWEIGLIAAIAVFLAWLRLLTDFHRYKGFLHVLLWNGYSWVFLTFIAACTFLVDYAIWPYIAKIVHRELILHVSLFIGHTGASAAFAYAAPPLLAKIPRRSGEAPGQPPDRLRKEKKTTEMNVVFAAIRESLENRVNGRLVDWTTEYDWPVLRFAAHMLATDQVSSGMIAPEEGERLGQEVDTYKKCDDLWEDRQKKYELLRKMMNQCSFRDLHARLKQAGKKS